MMWYWLQFSHQDNSDNYPEDEVLEKTDEFRMSPSTLTWRSETMMKDTLAKGGIVFY